jgi:hypothetical protein
MFLKPSEKRAGPRLSQYFPKSKPPLPTPDFIHSHINKEGKKLSENKSPSQQLRLSPKINRNTGGPAPRKMQSKILKKRRDKIKN